MQRALQKKKQSPLHTKLKCHTTFLMHTASLLTYVSDGITLQEIRLFDINLFIILKLPDLDKFRI